MDSNSKRCVHLAKRAFIGRTGRAVRAGRANRTRQLHKEGRYSVTVDWTVRRTKCGWTWYIRGNSSDPKLTGLREECSGTEGQANKYVQKVAFATTFTPCELPSRHRKMQRESQSPRRGKKKGKNEPMIPNPTLRILKRTCIQIDSLYHTSES